MIKEKEEYIKHLREYIATTEMRIKKDVGMIGTGILVSALMGVSAVLSAKKGSLVVGYIDILLGYFNVITTYRIYLTRKSAQLSVYMAREELKSIEGDGVHES